MIRDILINKKGGTNDFELDRAIKMAKKKAKKKAGKKKKR